MQRGESLTGIAARYRVTQQAIMIENGITNARLIKTGRRLSLPGCRPAKSKRELAPPPAIELDDGLLLARVGPQRVPTKLYVAVPEFGVDGIQFGWPVEGAIASHFGKRRMGWHAGIDIQAEAGAPITAAAAGTILYSGWAPFYGLVVKIQHPLGFVTVYAHNSENLVEQGDEVQRGAVIAMVGRTGQATASHLHFEIRRDGMAYNPLHLLDPRDSEPVLVSLGSEPLEEGLDLQDAP